MLQQTEYYVVRKKAVPEVLLKVVEAKYLVESGTVDSIAEAVERVGISRSSFYKYKDDIDPFYNNVQGQTITLSFQMNDIPGLLSEVLQIISNSGLNILTIHQSIPINGVASLSISMEVLPEVSNVSGILEKLEAHTGVHGIHIFGRE